jgi:hypothetical protein
MPQIERLSILGESLLVMVITMIERQSESIGRDAQSAVLLRHKWQAEIEKAVDKVKLGVVPARKRTNTDKWFRRQWYRAMMRDRKRAQNREVPVKSAQLTSQHSRR